MAVSKHPTRSRRSPEDRAWRTVTGLAHHPLSDHVHDGRIRQENHQRDLDGIGVCPEPCHERLQCGSQSRRLFDRSCERIQDGGIPDELGRSMLFRRWESEHDGDDGNRKSSQRTPPPPSLQQA